MNPEASSYLRNIFNILKKQSSDEAVEFWFVRDMMEPLDYARWENFSTAIRQAIESCQTTGYNPENHFRGITQMVGRAT